MAKSAEQVTAARARARAQRRAHIELANRHYDEYRELYIQYCGELGYAVAKGRKRTRAPRNDEGTTS